MAETGFVSGPGTHSFRFDGPGDTPFSVTAVLVEEEHKREVEAGCLRILQRHFPGGQVCFAEGEPVIVQLRSLLKELKGLYFSFHALLVDKRQLHHKSPLRYEGAFYEFLSGLTYNYRARYVHTHELLQHLNAYGCEQFTVHRFRALVVRPVRDERVFLVPSGPATSCPARCGTSTASSTPATSGSSPCSSGWARASGTWNWPQEGAERAGAARVHRHQKRLDRLSRPVRC